MDIPPSLPSALAIGAPLSTDEIGGADDSFLALLVGLLTPATPLATVAGPVIDQPTAPADDRQAYALPASAPASEPSSLTGTSPAPFERMVPELEEKLTATTERSVSTAEPLWPTASPPATPAAESPPPDQPVGVGASADPAIELTARSVAGHPSSSQREDRKDGTERPSDSDEATPASDRASSAGAAAPPTIDAPAAADSGPPAANVIAPLAAGRTQDHAAATQTERLAPTVLTVPDAQGREVTARLVVTGGTDGQPLRIELQPADLGRVEVSLRLHDSGAAAASFTVDRLETLQLLQRDARTVTEMLTAAGFTVDQGSLAFTLRDGGNDHGRPRQQPAEEPRHSWDQQPDRLADEPRGRSRRSLLDLCV